MSEQLTRPAHPTYPTMPEYPDANIPERGWPNVAASAIAGMAGVATWLFLIATMENAPGANYAAGVSAAVNGIGYGAMAGVLVYVILTAPYWLRERRAAKRFSAALTAHRAERTRLAKEYEAAVAKWTADMEAYREADDAAFQARLTGITSPRGDNANA
jgi:hypothetical protein